MSTKPITVSAFVIQPEDSSLDPIRVVFYDAAPSQGWVTISCYGSAWYAFFAAMGTNEHPQTTREFFMQAGNDYLVNRLMYNSRFSKHLAAHANWLTRIVCSIQEEMRAGRLNVNVLAPQTKCEVSQ